MKTALIQMPVGFDKKENIRTAEAYLKEAAIMGADMAVLPEMFCCPYSNKYFRAFAEPEGGSVYTALAEIAAKLSIIVVGGSVPELHEDKTYNTSYVFGRMGEQLAKCRKTHMFDIDIVGGQRFFESKSITPGDEIVTFDSEFGVMGLCICFDFRFSEVASVMSARGARVIIVPAAFNMTTGPAHWELMFRQRAVDNQLFTLGVSPARSEGGVYVAYGNSIAVSPWGEVIARCGGGACTLFVDIDFNQVESIRRQLPILSARRKDLYSL